MVHYRNRGDHSLTIDLSNARKNDRETTRNVLRTNALGPCPIKGILKETRRRRYENTEQKRERQKRIELAKTNSVEVEAGARGKLAVWSREK